MKKSIIFLSLFISNAYGLTWSAVETLSTDKSPCKKPKIVIDSSANRNVIWQIQSEVQATEGISSWTAPQVIFSGSVQNGPYLVGNDSGDAIMYLTALEAGYSICKICEYSSNTWDPVQDFSPTDQNVLQPNFCILSSSNAAGVWGQREGSDIFLKSSIRTGDTWTPYDITQLAGEHTIPCIGLENSGNAVSVWVNKAENYFQICSSSFSGSDWSSPSQVSDIFQTIINCSLSINSAGFGAVSWTELMGVSWNVKVAIYQTGSWSAPVLVSPAGENDQHPYIAVNDNNTAICTWERRQKGILNIFCSMYSAGTWSSPQLLYAGSTDSKNPRVFLNNADQAIVIWTGTEDSQEKVYGCTYINDTWSAGESLIPEGEIYDCITPDAAINDNGDVGVVWIIKGNRRSSNNNSVQFIQSNLNS